jgi:hypothetical protein
MRLFLIPFQIFGTILSVLFALITAVVNLFLGLLTLALGGGFVAVATIITLLLLAIVSAGI